MNADSTFTHEEFENADAVVAIKYDDVMGGFLVHSEGNDLVSRSVLGKILHAYGQNLIEEEAGKN